MAMFCANCGGRLEPGAKFCAQCGQLTGNATAQAPQPAAAAAPAPAVAPAAGGGAIKIILIVAAVIGFCMLLGLGSCFYVAYRVKQRAHEFAGNYAPYQGKKDACALVTKAEVSQAFKMPVESVSGSDSHCEFKFAGNDQHAVAMSVTWESGAMLMKITHGAMKQVGAGMDTFTPVAGLGDEAYVEPMGSGLMLRKGDVMVNIDLRMAGNDADAAKIIGTKIASRL
ncbi:MAG: zinc ribbon domain-containing protein [Acidobacteriaceae bacterium]|nr:zinc ribbon domain-containing protein [Acidobacteriaceae bacterium]